MLREKLVSPEECVTRVTTDQLELLLHKQLDPVQEEETRVLAQGLPASPGAAVGQVVFDSARAQALADQGKEVI
jgi:pyruvate,orthophosphate dikinase